MRETNMNRTRLMVVAVAVLGSLAVSAPLVSAEPTSAASSGEWHRNNYNAGEEQLFCREAEPSWTCTYVVPDGTGWFSGRNVTANWTCPAWFASTICDNVTAVYRGMAVYVPGDAGAADRQFRVPQEYLVTEVDGQAVLQLYWVDRFVCPWYRTYDEALAADFNCTFAP
jgi:hypothetical protein